MKNDFLDIIERAGQPDWYDENGTPRYGEYEPRQTGVYQKASTLYLIICQGCEKDFLVSYSWDRWPARMFYKEKYGGPPESTGDKEADSAALREYIDRYEFDPDLLGYGDPPIHGCAGDTMSSSVIGVIEHWERDNSSEYQRVRHKEGVVDGVDDLKQYYSEDIIEDLKAKIAQLQR